MPFTEAHVEIREEFDRKLEGFRDVLGAERVAELLRTHRERYINDDSSVAPGVTLFLVSTDPEESLAESFQRMASQKGRPLLVAVLQDMGPEAPGHYKMELPTGGFALSDNGFNIFHTVSTTGEGDGAGFLVWLSYGSIVRMEGHHGELWQNENHDPNGALLPQDYPQPTTLTPDGVRIS